MRRGETEKSGSYKKIGDIQGLTSLSLLCVSGREGAFAPSWEAKVSLDISLFLFINTKSACSDEVFLSA